MVSSTVRAWMVAAQRPSLTHQAEGFQRLNAPKVFIHVVADFFGNQIAVMRAAGGPQSGSPRNNRGE